MTTTENGATGSGAPATSEVIIDAGPEHRPTQATELLRAEAGSVQAQTVTMERAGAEQVSAERLIMNNSGARTIDAQSAQVDRSGVLAVKSDKAVFLNSSAIAVSASEARIVRGNVLLLRAESVQVEGDAKIGVLAGPGCEAVRPLVDIKGAAAFGAAVGLACMLLGAIVRRLVRG